MYIEFINDDIKKKNLQKLSIKTFSYAKNLSMVYMHLERPKRSYIDAGKSRKFHLRELNRNTPLTPRK